MTATYNGIELIEKTDYTVVCQNNKKPGENTATITVSGKGNFSDKVHKTYSIMPSCKDNITFSVSDTLVPAKLSKLKPKVSVTETATKKKLTAGKDYNGVISYYVTDESGELRTIAKEDLKGFC